MFNEKNTVIVSVAPSVYLVTDLNGIEGGDTTIQRRNSREHAQQHDLPKNYPNDR